MSAPTTTILTVDIVNSTGLYQNFGDQKGHDLVSGALAEMRDVIEAHDGEVVHEIGDELACRFAQTASAAQASCALHAAMRDLSVWRRDKSAVPLTATRVGLHRGPISAGADPLACETGKLARWAARNANPEQTLATLPVIEDLPERFRSISRFVDDETWDFVSLEHIELFEIVWDVEAITATRNELPIGPQQPYSGVVLGYRNTQIRLDADQPVASVGRGGHNALVVAEDLVSRQHFSVQFSRGRCTLTDNSTNGTYVVWDGEPIIILRRDSYPLHGTGKIFLGEPNLSRSPVHFRCFYEDAGG